MIKGITVTLESLIRGEIDDFNRPTESYAAPVSVSNVLVTPTSADDLTSDIQLYGRRSEFTLCIPKGDTHSWEGARISFFGRSYKAFTPLEEWIESMVPLKWNRKIRVERIE